MADPMTQGTRIHYVRPQETGCRPGTLLADSFPEQVTFPHRGLHEFGHVAYGDPPGSDTKHTFQVLRKYDPLGTADTWHLASDCPAKVKPSAGAGGSSAQQGRAAPQAP